MGRKEPWNILDAPVGGLELAGDANEFVEEGGAGAAESKALAGDGEVLARESADEQMNWRVTPSKVCAGPVRTDGSRS